MEEISEIQPTLGGDRPESAGEFDTHIAVALLVCFTLVMFIAFRYDLLLGLSSGLVALAKRPARTTAYALPRTNHIPNPSNPNCTNSGYQCSLGAPP